jgi:Uma2 family endonuclease
MVIAEKSEHRLEYLNGEIYQMASPAVSHQKAVGNIYFLFKLALKGNSCDVFVSPFDVHFWKKDIKNPDVLQPDVFIACDTEDNINDKDRYMGIPSLVVEVLSPSTRSRDILYKMNTYMTSGVKEYWVVDPTDKKVIVYVYENYEMKHMDSYKAGLINSFAFDVEITVEDVFEL